MEDRKVILKIEHLCKDFDIKAKSFTGKALKLHALPTSAWISMRVRHWVSSVSQAAASPLWDAVWSTFIPSHQESWFMTEKS